MSLPHFQSPIGYFSVRCPSACHSICIGMLVYAMDVSGLLVFFFKIQLCCSFSFQFCCMKITYNFHSHFVSLARFLSASPTYLRSLFLFLARFLCVIFPLYIFFLPSIHITIIRLVTSVSNSKLSCLRASQAVVCVLHFNPVHWFGMWKKGNLFSLLFQSYL